MQALGAGVAVELDALVRLRHVARDTDFLPRQPARSLLAGRRVSKLRGRGMDFEELRAYVPGDDIRSMDWRVTARTGRPYVRSYREERDRPVLLLVDQRRSMFFGSHSKMKSVAAAELAALAAWRVVASGDRVGALLFGQRLWAFRPARSEAQVQRICEGLVESTRALVDSKTPAQGGDALEAALHSALQLCGHDALVFVISDFRAISPVATELLGRIRQHNDLLLAWVTDPLEEALPDVGTVPLTEPRASTGARRLSVATADAALRQRFAQEFARERARFQEFAQRAGGSGFELRTDAPVEEQLRATLGRARRGGR